MIKDKLKEKETVAYLSLKNDLNSGHIAHSYLLYGELNPFKTEVAFLLAQSIVEGKNDFACETCTTCQRIRDGKYFDVIYVDGHKETIKKEQIDHIVEEFNKTSLEAQEKKIYIIDNINNSTDKVLNMILKFMEEPGNSNTYGIFISDNIDTLLETVVSRCKKIPFVSKDFSYLIEEYEKLGYSAIDSYLLSQIKHELINDDELLDNFGLAKEFVYKTIDNLSDPEYLPILFNREFYNTAGKDNFKECSGLYLDIMALLISDSNLSKVTADEEYNAYLRTLDKYDKNHLYEVILNAKDKCNLPISRSLLFDQIAYEIIS
ncbi:MAG: hypothetical protein Q4B60_00805 [Erysipelotrichaceae bacterium]|nr:hypothetical protein [Erysipelotrichaceae bacterium]